MMMKKRKFPAVLLTLLVALLLLAAAVFTDSIPATAGSLETGRIYAFQNEIKAASMPGTEGLRFDEADEGGIEVVGYVGSETEILIPSEAFWDVDGSEEGEGKVYRVAGIRSGAFKNCSSLTGITISEGLTYIGWEAFFGCSNLTDITIPEGIVSIETDTFRNCSSLQSIRLPDSISSIEFNAFNGCSSLQSISLPDGISSIESGAFYGCSSLESITLPGSLVNLDDSVFKNCNSLKSVTLPAGFTGSLTGLLTGPLACFDSCIGLEELNINSGNPAYASKDGIVYNKEGTQLVYCPIGRKSMEIPADVTDIDLSRFLNRNSLEELLVDSRNPAYSSSDGILYGKDKTTLIFCPEGRRGTVIIPEGVTGISGMAFQYCKGIESVTIPGSVITIGRYAFSSCENLTNVVMSEGTSNIELSAFSDCKKLKSVTIPGSVAKMDSGIFSRCSSLTDVKIAEGVTGIGGGMFSGCSSLSSVKLPESLTSIGGDAFYGCSSLADIAIPAGVTSIGGSAFKGTKWLENRQKENPLLVFNRILFDGTACRGNVVLPKDVESIMDGAFKDCKTITGVTIPEGVAKIGSGAFSGCSSLESVTIAGSVTSVGNGAFRGTKWLEEKKKINPLVIANHIVIDASTCSGDIVIPEGVTIIAGGAFSGYTDSNGYSMPNQITGVTIPSSMTSIDERTFSVCDKLKYAAIPASVARIGREAFGWFIAFEDYCKIDGFVIYGESGTEAEWYAKENGFEFRLISDKPSQGGDSKTDISKATVTLARDSYIYDGKPKTPSVTVKLDGKTLVPGTDYSVSYSGNTNAGTAKVTVTGKGSYQGSVEKTFSIKKAASRIVCKKTVYDVAYGIKPFLLMASADGALSYSSSAPKVAAVDQKGKVTVKGAGIAYITIRSGSDSLKITIKASPKKQTVSSVKANKGRKITVKWKKDGMATGYQVQCSTDKNFKKGIITANAGKGSMTSISIGKLKTGKIYYVRIRSCKTVKVGGKNQTLYGAWSGYKKSGKIIK